MNLTQVPKSVQTLLSKFPLYTYPPNEPKKVTPQHPTLWIKTPYPGSLLSTDVECLKWQAYLALRGLTHIHVRYDLDQQAAIDGKLPNLHIPASAHLVLKDTKKISDGVSELIPATALPTWADGKLKQPLLDPAEGYKDEAARDESRAWITLLEGNVHAALILSQPPPTIFQPIFSFQDTRPNSQLAESIITPPLPPITGIRALLPPILQGSRVSLSLVQSRFQEAIAALSDRLGTDKWFLGSEAPTALDALVFAYLHCLLQSPLRSIVNNRANLTAYEFRVRGIVDGAFKRV